MQVTLFSFFISVVWSSFLIVVIYLFRKMRFLICQFGVMSLVLLYLFCAIRMAVPLDFTFTKGISLEGMFSGIYERVVIKKIGMTDISVLLILFFLWIAGSSVLLVGFVYQYHMAKKEISTYPIRQDEQCQRVFAEVVSGSKRQVLLPFREINIRYSGEVNTPRGLGIFDRSIILPDEAYTDKELYYILKHEYTHFLNRDLLVKMLIHIFCCVFWWNPIVYFLEKDVSQALEIKCDLCVTEQMDNRERADYLAVILSILKKADTDRKTLALYSTAQLVSKDHETEIVERFRIVSGSHRIRRGRKILPAIGIAAFLAVFAFSYSFVLQPCYEAPVEEIETESDARELRPDNTYILKGKDGIYTIVLPSGTRQDIDEKFAIEMAKQGINIVKEED